MEQELDLAAKSGSEAAWIVTTVRARNAFAQGQVRKGRQYYQQCQEIAGRINLPELQAGLFSDQATSEVIVGYKQPAITLAEKAIAVSKAPSSLLGGGLVMALAGQNARAEELAKGVSRRRPDDTLAQSVYVPHIEALIEMNQGNPEKALQTMNAGQRPTSAVMWERC